MKNWEVIQVLEEHIPDIMDYITIPDIPREEFDMRDRFVMEFKTNDNNYNRVTVYSDYCGYPLHICSYITQYKDTYYKTPSKAFVKRIADIVSWYNKKIEKEQLTRDKRTLKIEDLQLIADQNQKEFGNNLRVYNPARLDIEPFIVLKIGETMYNVNINKGKVDIADFSHYGSVSERSIDADLAIPVLQEMELRRLLE